MKQATAAKLAVAAIAGLLPLAAAQAQASASDYAHAPVAPGSWGYVPIAGGSEARFMDSTGTIRLAIGCARATGRVSIARISTAPAASLSVWTNALSRSLPARFDQKTFRVTAELGAHDPLLDAIAFSRGRFAVAMPGSPVLVVASAPEAARIVEDCRA